MKSLKKFFIFWETELSYFLRSSFPCLKEMQKAIFKKFLIYWTKVLGLGYLQRLSKGFYTFPYKEVKFSKLKHFLIIIMKSFLQFYNTFFYTQQAFVFNLLRFL